MTFHNSPDGYRGIVPLDERVLANTYLRDKLSPELRDGLFYRRDVKVEPLDLETKLLSDTDSATIQDYQYWAEAAWKAEHSSYAAVERFGVKLKEEAGELLESYEDLKDAGQDRTESEQKMLKECGDVLWCTTALASCAMADVDSGTKNLLFRYVMGVRHFDVGKPVEPKWRSKAGALATKYHQLGIKDIDDLLAVGFEPLPSTVMNVDDIDEDDGGISEHLVMLFGYCLRLINGADEQYGRGAEEDENLVMESYFLMQSRQAGELVGQIYLELAFIANRALSKSLADIIRENVAKLATRVATQTVDKVDGPRNE